MGKIFVLAAIAMLMVTVAMATSDGHTNKKENCDSRWFCNQELVLDCQKFYGDSQYYTIAKWSYDGHSYKIDERNNLYRYYEITVNENLNKVDWTSSSRIESVLVKEGNATTEFTGDIFGSINSTNDVNQLIFCGHKNGKSSNSNAAVSNNDGQNNVILGKSASESSGVPEFPAMTIEIAVLVATLGLVFMRKN